MFFFTFFFVLYQVLCVGGCPASGSFQRITLIPISQRKDYLEKDSCADTPIYSLPFSLFIFVHLPSTCCCCCFQFFS